MQNPTLHSPLRIQTMTYSHTTHNHVQYIITTAVQQPWTKNTVTGERTAPALSYRRKSKPLQAWKRFNRTSSMKKKSKRSSSSRSRCCKTSRQSSRRRLRVSIRRWKPTNTKNSGHFSDDRGLRWLEQGARGCLEKQTSMDSFQRTRRGAWDNPRTPHTAAGNDDDKKNNSHAG